MYQIYYILEWYYTCLGGLSVHLQEFKTVHTATGICQTNTAVCLDTLHVSDGLSIHHQEFQTVHTATKQILLSA